MSAAHRGFVLVLTAFLASCDRDAPPATTQVSSGTSARAASAEAPARSSPSAAPSAAPARRTLECPAGMVHVPGGQYWAGNVPGRGPRDESPRYQTQLAPYCLDTTEVTTGAYNECVRRGVCTPAHGQQKTCNGHRKDRNDHPINCVDWQQAVAYCQAHGKRLPSEVEWEFAARGGLEGREYSWGSDAPDGRTCWKEPHSCPVGKQAAGAFGLHDMTGNVWEWTATWYGPYPWPPLEAHHRVYRGGSWSRRFEKWMKTTLRNRLAPDKWGSHLGFRCAAPYPDAQCPYGASDDGTCRHGVDAVECPNGEAFNGVRCARRGAPRCPPGHSEVTGFGCVSDAGNAVGRSGVASASSAPTAPTADPEAEVTRSRSPAFDEDCRKYQPTRPQAYRFEGGSHVARNRVGKRMGCKNRDVGVGYNSACCP